MTIKEELKQHYLEQEADFDKEETKNVIEILNVYDENLTGLRKWDKTLLLRLVNDDELYDKLDSIEIPSENENLFD